MHGNRGLGFSMDAVPLWVASALFWKDKAGPWPSPSAWEQVLKGEQEDRRNTRCLLDIMAKESYLLQETIYSNRQTMISNYNGTKIGKGDNGKQ